MVNLLFFILCRICMKLSCDLLLSVRKYNFVNKELKQIIYK